MSEAGVRQNRDLLRWLIAFAFGVSSWFALSGMQFSPPAAAALLAVAVGGIALFSTDVAAAAFVLTASIPLLAANAVVGLAFLVVGLAATQYLGGDVIPILLVVAAAFVGAVLGPVWAVPVLAGYLLGSRTGTLAALVACIVLEVAGVVLGDTWSSTLFLGGTKAFVVFTDTPENLLTFAWVGPAFRSIGAESAKNVWSALTETRSVAVLLIQPIVWALAATLAGGLRRPAEDSRQLSMSIVASVAGVVIVALGSLATYAAFNIELDAGAILLWGAVSALIAAVGAVVWDRFFRIVPPPVVEGAAVPFGQRSAAAEDADVDELLRLISSAEDKIANQHTTESVVMITDMKSFSRMTEEEGSFVTAKAVQRHRDLLLPLIETRGGKGKSTGGDGLIASFASADNAVCAAIEMQQALQRYNAAHPREREILVRVGIADGEVVLDKGGRPFIGAALNLAARVMSLGDGGQVLVTRDIVSKANDPNVIAESHGEFELKNIAQPVEVVEVLWADGQVPCDPRTSFAPKPQEAGEPQPEE